MGLLHFSASVSSFVEWGQDQVLIKELQEVQGPPRHKVRCAVWPGT